MKRLSLVFIALTLAAATLTGCQAQSTVSIFGGSYFLSDYENHSVGFINETATYKLSFEAGVNKQIAFTLEDGTYTTRVTDTEYDGNRCYKSETELVVKGSYVIDGVTTPVDDRITSTAYFLGVDKALKPLYSTKTVKAHTLTLEKDKYRADFCDYVTEITYGDKDAVVTFTPNEETSTVKYALQAGTETYKDVFNKTYFDNETLLFAIRSLQLNVNFGAAFDCVDAVSKTKRTLSLSAAGAGTNNADATAKEVVELNYTHAGEKLSKVDTFRLNLAVSGTFTGSNISLNYSDPANKKLGQQLIRMQTSLPYSAGTLTYLITSTTRN